MKDCKQFQQQYLLDGGCQNAEIAEHFIKCPQCQAFAQDYAQILPEATAQPSAELEKDLRMACLLECATLRRKQQRRRMLYSFISVAAAVVVIACAVLHYSSMLSHPEEQSHQVVVTSHNATLPKVQDGAAVFDDSNEFVWNTACTLSENELDVLELDLALYVFNP